MNKIVEVLMRRDGLSRADAEASLMDGRSAVADGDAPEEVLLEVFGLEPDYIFDLLGGA